MSRTLFEQITESPEVFVDWLLADKEMVELSDGTLCGIETAVLLQEADSSKDCGLFPSCEDCEEYAEALPAIEVPDLTAEQLDELKEALLTILNQEV